MALLDWRPDAPVEEPDMLLARILTSLAHAEAEQARSSVGLELLDFAQSRVPREGLGYVHSQRGLVLLRLGRQVEALRQLDVAVPLLARQDRVELARILLNRAVIHLSTGRVGAAREDARRSRELATRAGQEIIAAKALHNLGYCDFLTGDLPSALAVFAQVREQYAKVIPGFLPVLALDQARTLMAAGLCTEAGRILDENLALFRRQRLVQDYGEAELERARCEFDAGNIEEARRWARRAATAFRRRGTTSWLAKAQLMELRCDFARVGGGAGSARRGDALADRLTALGLRDEAEMASLLAVRAALAAGDVDSARSRAGSVTAPRRRMPVELRLMHRLAEAELAIADGRCHKGLERLRSGLLLLQTQRARLGDLDLLTGAAALGADLARTGLSTALVSGSPQVVFSWSERSRAQAFRHRRIRFTHDAETAEALVELRHLRDRIRTDPKEGRRHPELRERCGELERFIREKGWQQPGDGTATTTAGIRRIQAELGAAGLTMVVLIAVDGRVSCLVLRDGTVKLVPLCPYEVVAEAARRLRADLGVMAGRHRPAPLRRVIEKSVAMQLATLSNTLISPITALLGDAQGLVIVPTRNLSTIPWGLLPLLRGRPLVVAPSATVWLTAQHGRRENRMEDVPVLVAGPGLEYAETEVERIADLYPASRRLTGAAASVEATLAALNGAPLAHLAAHGYHERENVQFSRLDLSDGPLMAYDMQRLERAPGHVVLSSCDAGQTVVRPGDEVLGLASALLYTGSSTVVASLTRVPDDVAFRVMTAYHLRLIAGEPPGAALAVAAEGEMSTFICLGAG
ncbi:CHAT domain-containing protein [Planobispora takensis]|uniref:CHAT domain-containing protein n=1 Tax=Planobispora takensis TaxID=1367882 RepID=A0A8J3SYG3_9ACTN|nr:CHAT domain-containing protein [Planobispora takensis]